MDSGVARQKGLVVCHSSSYHRSGLREILTVWMTERCRAEDRQVITLRFFFAIEQAAYLCDLEASTWLRMMIGVLQSNHLCPSLERVSLKLCWVHCCLCQMDQDNSSRDELFYVSCQGTAIVCFTWAAKLLGLAPPSLSPPPCLLSICTVYPKYSINCWKGKLLRGKMLDWILCNIFFTQLLNATEYTFNNESQS